MLITELIYFKNNITGRLIKNIIKLNAFKYFYYMFEKNQKEKKKYAICT